MLNIKKSIRSAVAVVGATLCSGMLLVASSGMAVQAATYEQVNYQTARVVYDPETGDVYVYFDYSGSDLTADESAERAVAQGAVDLGNLVSLIDANVNIEDQVSVQQYMDENGITYTQTATVGVHNGVITQSVTQTIDDPNAPATEEEGTGEAEQKTEEEKNAIDTSTASHGPFDGLSQEALDTFSAFANDAERGNCYITVFSGTDKNKMPSDTLFAVNNDTRGTIYFVDKDNYVQYGYTFYPSGTRYPDVQLGATVTKRANGIYFNMEKSTDLPSPVRIMVYTGERNTQYYVFDKTGKMIDSMKTDDSGFAIMKTVHLQSMVFSKNQSLEAALQNADAEEQPAEEPEAEEDEGFVPDRSYIEDNSVSSEEPAKKSIPIIPIAAGAAGLAAIGGGAFLLARRH